MLTKSFLFFMLVCPVSTIAGADLETVFTAYQELQAALAGDDLQEAKSALSKLTSATTDIEEPKLEQAIQPVWNKQAKHLSMALKKAGTANDLSGIRKSFEHISMALIALSKVSNPGDLQEYRCPMAFNIKGANWLQKAGNTANPYYGSAMLRCGAPVKAKHQGHNHHH